MKTSHASDQAFQLPAAPGLQPEGITPARASAARATVASRIPAADFRHSQSIELHIEELVLDGYAPDHSERFARAVASELTRLLSARGLQPALTESLAIEQLAGSAFRLKPAEPAEAAGQQLAKALYTSLNRGMRR